MTQLEAASADVNLLFGVLAVQLNFITQDAMLKGMNAWVLNKGRSLGEILVEQRSLTKERKSLLDSLVKEHLQTHQNAAEQSLASLPDGDQWQTILEPIRDPDVTASLRRVVPPPPAAQPPKPTTPEQVAFNETMVADPEATAGENSSGTAPRSLTSASANRFKIVRLHAKGGLGEVYVAQDGEIHREVALKHIQDHYADDAESRQRFVSEAEITGSLEHPSIVPVYGLGQYPNGRPYYAMRFIRGESFKSVIDDFHKGADHDQSFTKHRLMLRQLLGQFVDVCNAIDYSHNRRVIHRDLKPANIMLGKFGETFVVDWGLAKPVDEVEASSSSSRGSSKSKSNSPGKEEGPVSLIHSSAGTETRMGTQVGTPQFMSPEQAAGKVNEIHFASDIYSLGATLYYLLTGVAPFVDKDLWTILKRVQEGEFPKPREVNRKVPKVLQAICLKAMSLKPADRHRTARALANEIECWLADEPVGSYQETLVERIMRWTRRHRAWTQAIIGSVFLIAVVATVSAVMIGQARESERKALGIAQKEREASEASFQKARKTVDQFFTSVSETKLLNVPGLQPLRQELLRDALAYYEGFVEQRGDDPKLREELAATFFRIGLITGEIGAKSDALRSLDRALSEQQALLQENPKSTELQIALGNTLNALGDTTLAMGEYQTAIDYFTQAKDQREAAAKLNADDPQLQRKVLNSYDNIAVALSMMGSKQKAIQSYEEVNVARAKLAASHPGDDTFERDLATGYFNLSQLHVEIGDYKSALDAMGKSEEVFQRLVALHPTNIDYSRQLSVVQRLTGDIQVRLGQFQEAGETYAKAAHLGRKLAQANPLVAQLRHDLVKIDVSRGLWCIEQGDIAAATGDFDEALVLLRTLASEEQDGTLYLRDLANVQLQRGDLLRKTGQLPEACEALADAVRLYEEPSLKENPQVPQELANARIYLGMSYLANGNPAQAVPILETVLTQCEQLAAKSPKNLGPQLLLAQARTQLGAALGAVDKAEEGLNLLQTAAVGLNALRPIFPESDRIDVELSDVYARITGVHYTHQRIDDAITALRQVIELRTKLSERPTATTNEVAALAEAMQSLSYILLDSGKQADALKVAQDTSAVLQTALQRFPDDPRLTGFLGDILLLRFDLEKDQQQFDLLPKLAEQAVATINDPPTLIDLARRFAVLAMSLEGDEATKEFVDPLRKQALAACSKVAAKYPKVLEELRKDKELESMQTFPGWKELLEEK